MNTLTEFTIVTIVTTLTIEIHIIKHAILLPSRQRNMQIQVLTINFCMLLDSKMDTQRSSLHHSRFGCRIQRRTEVVWFSGTV